MLLSVVIPAYNEANTIEDVFEKVVKAPYKKEIIIVDNGSEDATYEIIKRFSSDQMNKVKVYLYDKVRGKGAALREGFKYVEGDFVIIQDADLEYDPRDYPTLLEPLISGVADVVYGSRFIGETRRMFLFSHYIANKVLSFIANVLFDTIISDIAVGYKAFTREVLSEVLPYLRSRSFEFEVEFTARVLQLGFRLYEVPISYYGRSYDEGKKIQWYDAMKFIWWMIYCKFNSINTYRPKINLSKSKYIYEKIKSSLGERVCYIGAVRSHLGRFLLGKKLVILCGVNDKDVRYLRRKFRETSRLKIINLKELDKYKNEVDTLIIHNEDVSLLNNLQISVAKKIIISDKNYKVLYC